MLICKKCNAQNPLGRVFCIACGGKLDLQHMSSDEVAAANRKSLFSRFWWILPAIVVLILLICVGLALWPNTALVGAEGTRGGGRRVETQLTMAAGLVPGQTVRQEYTEKDINGYFQFFKDGKIGADSVRITISQGMFMARMSKTLWAPKFAKGIKLRVTYDVTCVPVGGLAVVRKASVGHLPVAGPFRKIAVGGLYGVLAAQKEWKGMANITDLKADTGKLMVVAAKK